MVTINGLMPTTVPKNKKATKGSLIRKGQEKENVSQPTKVATAVSQSIRHLNESGLQQAQVHYDLPEGQSRKAIEEYMDVLNQTKKDKLALLIGVDVYI